LCDIWARRWYRNALKGSVSEAVLFYSTFFWGDGCWNLGLLRHSYVIAWYVLTRGDMTLKVCWHLSVLGEKFWEEKYVFLSVQSKIDYYYCMCKLLLCTVWMHLSPTRSHTHTHIHTHTHTYIYIYIYIYIYAFDMINLKCLVWLVYFSILCGM
jgi:hypothetical protein